MSVFITILNDSFRIFRKNSKVNHNEDYEVLIFMFRKFQRWISKIDGSFVLLEMILY
jgi:hypothetical protein